MTKSIDFSQIIFIPDSKSLSILSAKKEVVKQVDLSQTSVKLQIVRDGRSLQAIIEEVAIGSLKSDILEIKTSFDIGGNNAALFFGTLEEKLKPSIKDGMTIGADNAYHLFWVGASDIRCDMIEEVPTGLLLMEGKIVSLEIQNSSLYLRNHETIG